MALLCTREMVQLWEFSALEVGLRIERALLWASGHSKG